MSEIDAIRSADEETVGLKTGEPDLPAVPRRTIRALTMVSLGLIALLNGADDVTTRLLTTRKAVEANPLAGFLLANGDLLWVKLGLVAVLGVVAARVPPKLGVLVVSWAVVGLYAAAVLSNILILRLT